MDIQNDLGGKMNMNINSNVSVNQTQIGNSKINTFQNMSEYVKSIQENFPYMNSGSNSIHGVPTSVSVSSAFLKKCMNDPEKAKFLEENLAAIPDCVNSLKNYTKMMPGSPTVTYTAYMIDANGNISVASGCTNDPDGKIARENAEKKAKKKKEEIEKMAERIAKKKEEEMAIEKRRNKKKEYTYTISGKSVESIIRMLSSTTFMSGGNSWRI